MPGKNRAVQRAFSKFNVKEVARTGKLAMKREPAYSEARRRRLEILDSIARVKELQQRNAVSERDARGSSSVDLDTIVGSSQLGSLSLDDLYKVENQISEAPIIDSSFNAESETHPPSYAGEEEQSIPHTLSIRVENQPGVLDRVTGVIARRGYNIQSVGVGPSESAQVSRMTLVVPGTSSEMESLLKQVKKLVSVLEATDITSVPFVEQELMMAKARLSLPFCLLGHK